MADEVDPKNLTALQVIALEAQHHRERNDAQELMDEPGLEPKNVEIFASQVRRQQQARTAKHAAFRSTLYLRELAFTMGINPVEILLYASAGVLPKFKPYMDEEGNGRLMPVVDNEGKPVFQELLPSEQLLGAREASKYLFPQLKAIDLAAELRSGTGADSDVVQAMKTFADLARAANAAQRAAVRQVEAQLDKAEEDEN